MGNLKLKANTLVLVLMLTACGTSLYDHYSFTQILETQVEALSLIAVSDQNYTEHRSDAEHLKNKIEAMVAYEQAKSKNEITIQMWKYLDNEQSSLQLFLKLWEDKGTLSPTFKEEFKPQIEQVFDLMANYETQKSKESESMLRDLITM